MSYSGKSGGSLDQYSCLADIILELEKGLRDLGLWESEAPSEESLASQAPFCVDTLNFTQWLQFVFTERIKWIIESEAPLPTSSGLVPMAEEYFVVAASTSQGIIKILREFDDLIARTS